ncbi:hypothetical protein [Sphingobacterium griseoflavum]|uniref:Lipoprotein n=1 Tax=Sphingobacterium griseoflavum TaxID=1474952 RepID=A0ABQ3HX65_9SPHI|nr:hypothetical protein [Sphingobacterium griseoflavum]GHE34975.1 hypothetical protein GCM10017764_17700 [Sphingobacterium griseoflavum]
MKNVSRILALVVMVTAFSSCGVLRKSKQKQSHKLEEISKRDSVEVSTATSSGEVKEKTIDKGTVTTEREVTTVTTKPGAKVNVKVNNKDLKHGENFIRDSAGLLVNLIIDTLKGTLAVQVDQPDETSTKTERETITEQKDVTKEREKKQEQQQEKQVAVTVEQRRGEKSSSSVSESRPSGSGILWNWIGGAAAVILVVVGLAWWFFGRGKK